MEFDRSFYILNISLVEKNAKNNRTLVTQSAVNLN
jgi:hypothetical protein